MGRLFVRYRGASPTPYSAPESEPSQILVKKTVTKEKHSNWGWTRASQTSSVSSVTEPARSASPVRVERYRSSSHHRHRSRHNHHHSHSSHPKALDHRHQDEHRHRHRRHRRRYSEDAPRSSPPAPRVREQEVVHKSCHCQGKPSPQVDLPHLCASPILVAVPIQSSRKMEEVGKFSYEEHSKRREYVPVPTETIAPNSSISNRSTQTQARTHSEISDHDNAYRYVPMREPGPQDAVVSLTYSEILCIIH